MTNPASDCDPRVRIQVAYVAPGTECLVALDVALGTTVAEAVRQSGMASQLDGARDSAVYAIFGKRVTGDTRLAEGDRVEITRPLTCDPKTIRRRRAARQLRNPSSHRS